MTRIAILEPNTLLGTELCERLSAHPRLGDDVQLYSIDEEAVGTMTEIGGGVALVGRWDRSRPLREAVVEIQRRQAELSAFEHVSPAAIRDVAELPPGVALFDTLVVANLDELDAPPWTSIQFRAMEARLDAAYPFVLGVEASGGGLELMLVHDASVDGAEVLARLAGVLNELAWADEDVRVDDAEVDQAIARMAAENGYPEPMLKAEFAKEGRREELINQLLEKKIFDLTLPKVKITEIDPPVESKKPDAEENA